MNKLLLTHAPIADKMFPFLFVTHEISVNSMNLTVIKGLNDVVFTILGVEIQEKRVLERVRMVS